MTRIELGETYVLSTAQDHIRRGSLVVAEAFDAERGIRVRAAGPRDRTSYVHVTELQAP